MKRIFIAITAITIGTAALVPAQAFAQVDFNIVIGSPPPPLRYEAVPAPRRGYEWVPGYWNWNGRNHTWSAGHWEQGRSGYTYQHPEWRQSRDGWHFNRGGWTQAERHGVYNPGRPGQRGGHRDNDHDGVPNRYDRDRDGDGVPNRNDSRPDNPRRN